MLYFRFDLQILWVTTSTMVTITQLKPPTTMILSPSRVMASIAESVTLSTEEAIVDTIEVIMEVSFKIIYIGKMEYIRY